MEIGPVYQEGHMDVERFKAEAERAGYLVPDDYSNTSDFRAGNKDRHQAHTALRKAFTEGRLTEDQYHTRTSHVDQAPAQRDLRRIVQDLPEAHAKERTVRDDLDRLWRNHPWTFHVPVMIGILTFVAACWVPEYAFLGGARIWNHDAGWSVIPLLGSFLGFIGLVINLVCWAD